MSEDESLCLHWHLVNNKEASRLASGMKTEEDLAKKVISSVEIYSHFSMIGKFQFFMGTICLMVVVNVEIT